MIRVVKIMKDPRWLLGMLWPLVLAVPYLPGVPKPSLGGLPWRQELAFAILLSLTVGLLLRRQLQQDPGGALNASARPLLIVGILFIIWIAASAVWAANPYSAIHYAVSWTAYILFFALMHGVAARPRAMRLSFYALGAIVWLLSVSCLIEWLFGAAINDHLYRANLKPLLRGFSGFGETMAVAAPIFGALALTVRKRNQALLCGATSLIGWLAILLALQRAPILGAAAGFYLLGIGVIAFKACRPRSFQRVGLLFASLVIVAVIQLFGPTSTTLEKNPSLGQRLQSTSISENNTMVRLLYWGVGIEMFRAHPFLGVGANNYEVAFGSGRAQLAASQPNSSLLGLNEQLLTQYAHNEYVQVLAELGIVGIVIFAAFWFLVARLCWEGLRNAKRPLFALGVGAGLLAFALSSAASGFSFRWFGGGLIFFFAAALVSQLAHPAQQKNPSPESRRQFGLVYRFAPATAFLFALLMLSGAGMQSLNSLTHAWAQASVSPTESEGWYRRSLSFNPFDAATNFDYGSLLYLQRRYPEAITHLQYAVDHGFNTSTSYAVLAAAHEQAGNLAASEKTLAVAANAYPQSVFLLVRHAAALSRQGRNAESEAELAKGIAIDGRSARGWYQLINFDIDAALIAAKKDTTLAMPGELLPYTAVYVVLKENERRLNIPADYGWRSRVGPPAK